MPKLSGIDLLTKIREVDDDVARHHPDPAFPSLETAASSIEHDVSAYIRKALRGEGLPRGDPAHRQEKGLLLRGEDELLATIGRTIRELRSRAG